MLSFGVPSNVSFGGKVLYGYDNSGKQKIANDIAELPEYSQKYVVGTLSDIKARLEKDTSKYHKFNLVCEKWDDDIYISVQDFAKDKAGFMKENNICRTIIHVGNPENTDNICLGGNALTHTECRNNLAKDLKSFYKSVCEKFNLRNISADFSSFVPGNKESILSYLV